MTITDNIKKIKKEVGNKVTILAATKKKSVVQIQNAIDAGIKVIGENYVQEAEKKYVGLTGVKKCFIGHLQKNKVKKAVTIFDRIVVDSIEIVEEIDKRTGKKIEVLIEVNVANEENKSGCKVSEVEELVFKIQKLKNVSLKGLFTMGPNIPASSLRPYFRKMKLLFDQFDLEVLSMGMSESYQIAIEEGATEVRLGTVLFGKR